jgi:hypothetical protein
LDLLESRLAPATFRNNVLTFQNTDGDTAIVALTRALPSGVTADDVFKFDTGTATDGNTTPQVLQEIDLTKFPNGTGVTVAAVNPTTRKLSTADVGWIDGTGVNLGVVRVSGDLGRVTAGVDGTAGTGLAALVVGSLGARGTATQAAGGDLASVIQGRLGALAVTGDINAASVSAAGNIGSIRVGGSLRGGDDDSSGLVSAGGNIGRVIVRGDLVGGAGAGSASIRATGAVEVVPRPDPNPYDTNYPPPILKWTGGRIASVFIGGSVTGGDGPDSASIVAATAGAIGPVTIRGDLAGGTGGGSASVRAEAYTYTPSSGSPLLIGGTIASVLVGGNVTGDDGSASGAVVAGQGVGAVNLGSVTGGSGEASGAVSSGGNIGSVLIRGSLVGGIGQQSGAILAGVGGAGSLGPVRITGDLQGGSGAQSGAVRAYGNASIQPVYTYTGGNYYGSGTQVLSRIIVRQVGGVISSVGIGGSLLGGTGDDSGTIAAVGSTDLGDGEVARGIVGPVTIRGDIRGGSGAGTRAGAIWAEGGTIDRPNPDPYSFYNTLPPFLFGGVVVSVGVGGAVRGGSSPGGASIQADHAIGSVTVAGNWTAGSIVAGYRSDGFFDPDTATATGMGGVIGTIRVGGGTISGTADPNDSFTFLADHIGALIVGGKAVALKAGAGNDDIQLDSDNNDFRLFEPPAATP